MRTSLPMAVRTVAVWLNVFVPFDINGAVVMVPAGPHAGKTALELGSTLLLTDQRAFSTDPRATSRMQSYVRIDLVEGEPIVSLTHRSDWAIVCDRERGEVVCRSRASTRRMVARVVSTDPVVVSLDCATSTSCPGAPPSLDEFEYRGTITYRPAARELSLDLMVALCPATEGYGAVNGGPGTIMFRQAPLPIAAWQAPRGARRRIHTVLAGHDGDGFLAGV
ncbi:MAG: hypothetical protein L3J97_07740 [Thermoplasmata archaeon]|nr:hypothetical protein [Thermoplasmata archaeon]